MANKNKNKISFDILPVLSKNKFTLVKDSKGSKIKRSNIKVKTKIFTSNRGY